MVLNESIAILLYVAQTHGPTPLLPSEDPARLARCLQWTLFGETEIGMSFNPLLAARFMAPEADKRNWSVIGLEQRLQRAVNHAERSIEGNDYLAGSALSLADISVSCGLAIWQGAFRASCRPNSATIKDG